MKNNDAYEKNLQTLTEAQQDMLDAHEEMMEKARKGKENYAAITRTKLIDWCYFQKPVVEGDNHE